MGRNYILTNNNSFQRGQKKKTIKREIVIGPNAIKYVSLVIVAILAVVYLSQSTAGASRSIKIRDFETKKAELMLEQERLESEQTRLKSLREIDNGVEKQVLEQGSAVSHVNVSANSN